MYDPPPALSLFFSALLCLQRKQRKHVLQLIPSRDVKPSTYGWAIGPCEASPITESSAPTPGSRVHPDPPMILTLFAILFKLLHLNRIYFIGLSWDQIHFCGPWQCIVGSNIQEQEMGIIF